MVAPALRVSVPDQAMDFALRFLREGPRTNDACKEPEAVI